MKCCGKDMKPIKEAEPMLSGVWRDYIIAYDCLKCGKEVKTYDNS